jgi:TRAP-type C4-dicarboxylate transport system permease small subunit
VRYNKVMLLIIHLTCAFASLALMAGAVIGSWRHKGSNYDNWAQLSGLSFGGLLATGTALAIKYHAHLMSVCLSGLFYLASLTALFALYRKLVQSAE